MAINKKDICVNYHSSICLNEDIYIDPLNIKKKVGNAKVVFVTHTHWDHLDEKSIKNVANAKTIFVCTEDSEYELAKMGFAKKNIVVVEPNMKFDVLGMKVETFPAYNINKEFHPKRNGWVGYKLTIGEVSYMICGDTDVTEELKKVKADVLFVPVGGTYTMDAKEAAQFVNETKPKLVVPMHYGEIVGGKEAERVFAENLNKDIECLILIKN